MKQKFSKLLTPIVGVFLFFITMMLTNTTTVEANSMDLYYPNMVVADSYTSEGAVTIKETMDVYAHNNGFGYRIDESHVRISSITITTASYTKTFSVDDENFSQYFSVTNQVAIPTNGQYGSSVNFETATVDKITLNLAKMYGELNVSGNAVYNNEITIKIEMQLAKYFLAWISGWDIITNTNSYKGGVSQTSESVSFKKTDASFTNNKLKVTGISLSKTTYNYIDHSQQESVTMTVTTNIKFIGYIRVYYDSTHYVSLSFSNTNTSTKEIRNVLLSNSMDRTQFNFKTFSLSGATDRYKSTMTTISGNDKSATLIVDTKKPTITSAGVSNTSGSTFHDVSEITSKFVFSENVEFTINTITFTIGDTETTRTCEQNCTSVGNEINLSYDLSGNGKVAVTSFTATIKDNMGNVQTYSNDISKALCVNNDVTLASSINSISTDYTYYYQGDTIIIKVSVADGVVPGTDISKIVIKHNETENVTFDNLSSAIVEDGVFTLRYSVNDSKDYITQIDAYDEINNLVHTDGTYIFFNRYLDLKLNGKTLINPENDEIVLYEGNNNDVFNSDKISLVIEDAAINTNLCEDWKCSYGSTKDGSDKIKLELGAITLASGQKNNEEIFTVVVNKRAPVVNNIELNEEKIYQYNSSNYYNVTDPLLSFELSDGYGDELCLYYKLNSGEFVRNCSDYGIYLPQETGVYEVSYYTSDGLNSSDVETYSQTFTYRGAFEKSNISLLVNEINIDGVNGNISPNKKYNSLTIVYNNAGEADLFKEFNAIVYAKTNLTLYSNENEKTFNVNFLEFGKLDDEVTVDLEFTDKLGNKLLYTIKVNIDTVAPEFTDIVAVNSKKGDVYTVVITGYGENSIYVEIDGIKTELVNNSFNTKKEKYTIVLTDSAGNSSEKVFTTVSPSIQLNLLSTTVYDLEYEVYITPFDNSIHQVEGFRYLVFDYKADVSDTMLEVARNNVCTIGRKVNCYVIGNYSSNVGQIYNTFAKGYSYILEVKINNVLAKGLDTNSLPRLDIVGPDATLPEGGFLDVDINPEYISSTSGNEFKFSFLAKDINLADNYYYMVVNSSLDSTMNVEKFYSLYTNCYGDTSENNKCGYKGENNYKEQVSGKENTYLGEVTIVANTNTKRRMINNVEYSLYVLLVDESTNSTLFKVRDFKNISQSSTIQYLDDNGIYQNINNTQEVITANTTTIKVSPYNGVGIKKLIINDVEKACALTGCNYELSIGKYVIEVEDELGNKNKATVFSATANNPIIYVNYHYNGEYFRILDNTLSYNTSNAANVYIKVTGNNLKNIKISMDTSKTYQSGDSLYDELTKASNQYGYNLSEIINAHNGSAYSGTVIISAENNDGGETIITLVVDNDKPAITLKPAGSNVVNLLGTLYDLGYSTGKYTLTYNYQRDITYALLMEELSLKVDGVSFDSIIDNTRFNFKANGLAVDNFDTSIDLGVKTITINYFDAAGNIADEVTIVLTIVDTQKPSISLLDQIELAEVNTSTSLATIVVEDNHDNGTSLSIKVTVDNVEINPANHKFTSVGEYEVVYTATDSAGNIATTTQRVFVKDTLPPTLKPGTVTEYTIGFNSNLELDIPVFVDNDSTLSEYKPYQITMFDTYSNLMNDALSNYPLTINGDKLIIRFVDSLQIGAYTIVFTAKDNQNNTIEATYTIYVTDREPPSIEVRINNVVVENGSSVTVGWGKDVTITTRALDSYQGDLSSKITRTLTFNGNTVNGIDTTVTGNYILTVSVKDNYNNTTTVSITIKVAKDETLPTINGFTLNEVEIKEGKITRLNVNYLLPVVDASDDSNLITAKIVIDNTYTVYSGQRLDLESNLSGKLYTVMLVVSDSSENTVTKTYSIIIDNKLPEISGFENNSIYHTSVDISIYDDNIDNIKIYQNGSLYETHSQNVTTKTISQEGLYRIVATDTYGNIASSTFAIYTDKKFNIVDNNNSTKLHEYSLSFLLEVKVDENSVTFILDDNNAISKNDKIYILVKYPHSNYKYIVYSMNGTTYLSNNTITADSNLIEGANNIDLLEKIDDKYYAYAMVIKGEADDSATKSKESNLGYIWWIVLAVIGLPLLLWLIIKLRRRVRAI